MNMQKQEDRAEDNHRAGMGSPKHWLLCLLVIGILMFWGDYWEMLDLSPYFKWSHLDDALLYFRVVGTAAPTQRPLGNLAPPITSISADGDIFSATDVTKESDLIKDPLQHISHPDMDGMDAETEQPPPNTSKRDVSFEEQDMAFKSYNQVWDSKALSEQDQKGTNWCRVSQWNSQVWEGARTQELSRDLFRKSTAYTEYFESACVKGGKVYLPPGTGGGDIATALGVFADGDYQCSTKTRNGGVRKIWYKKELVPYLVVADQDEWDTMRAQLIHDSDEAIISISNYLDYLAELFKNKGIYIDSLFVKGILDENMWIVPHYPDPVDKVPAFFETFLRPYTKRCILPFQNWLKFDRCYPGLYLSKWSKKDWNTRYGSKTVVRPYIENAMSVMHFYDIWDDNRPTDQINIAFIKRTGARTITNHDELVQKINEEFGPKFNVNAFSWNVPKTVPDKIREVRTFHVLVGEHGAGLLNGILPTGSAVFELFPIKVAAWCKWIYPHDLEIEKKPWLHYESLHICKGELFAGKDIIWQVANQRFPWDPVRRRIKSILSYLGKEGAPRIHEVIPGDYTTMGCGQRSKHIVFDKNGNHKEVDGLDGL